MIAHSLKYTRAGNVITRTVTTKCNDAFISINTFRSMIKSNNEKSLTAEDILRSVTPWK